MTHDHPPGADLLQNTVDGDADRLVFVESPSAIPQRAIGRVQLDLLRCRRRRETGTGARWRVRLGQRRAGLKLRQQGRADGVDAGWVRCEVGVRRREPAMHEREDGCAKIRRTPGGVEVRIDGPKRRVERQAGRDAVVGAPSLANPVVVENLESVRIVTEC